MDGGSVGSGLRVAIHTGENKVQLLGFAIEPTGFDHQSRYRCGDHAEKKLALFRLFSAPADYVFEIFLREALVGFTIVRSDAGAAAGKLIDQPIIMWAARHILQEPDDFLSETGGSIFKIEGMRCLVLTVIFVDRP